MLTFNDPKKEKLLKPLWEKGKMLVTFISHNVFYSFQNKFLLLGYIYVIVCKCFEFGLV